MSFVAAELFDECEGVDPGTYVASSQSCSAFIYCDGEDSTLDECEDGQYFDGEECDDQDNVECPLDKVDGEEEEQEEQDEEEEEPVKEKPQPVQTTTQPPTTEAQTIATTTPVYIPSEILDVAPIVKDSCPPNDDPNQIVLISNSNSCSDYYVCYHGNAIAMHCMDHLHFNVATGKCDFPENAKCKLAVQSPTEFNKCLPHMSEFFPHPTKCNYFYYCIKGYQTLQQCPFYYGWDIEKRTCIRMSQAKCYNSNS
ncbi:peritrophin-1-like [Musca autumnalis]|uniref:peritrophin-1-like n=1 Tax=Musca autumnalis TaxID=221902 RepID=UPI003CFACBA4